MNLLAHLTELERAATPGEWSTRDLDNATIWDAEDDCLFAPKDATTFDAALIAASRNALPLLLEVVRAAERLAGYKRPFHGQAFTNLQDALAPLLAEEKP